MNALKCLKAVCLPVAAIICAPNVTVAQDTGLGSWDWQAEVYFWGADLGGETTTGADISMPIDTIIEDLKLGFMGAIFAEKDDWLFFADAFYLDLGDSAGTSASVGPIEVDVNGSFDLKGFQSTFGAGYKIMKTAGTTLHATGGVRFLWLDGKVEVDATEAVGGSPIDGQVIRENEAGNNWDVVVGLRGITELNDKWYLSYYGDIGAGNSDLTWQASLAANYRMNRADLVIGYRYMDFDLDNFGPIDDLNLGGPFLGVKFSF
ncbi:hypothetical protein [Ruegeria arenilitoris]|uniref:Outer membrane protein beta-barrel domain-containing protein n=1 Tax=Ruegeria arenilitoris TaxID=1173585 RepID=A0A238L0P6_9RHOB|nr:hypothetical protein [Ruegeria arenilitoris]SMX48589.1 hypothetical protein RUA8715_03541 [Ruegeria arenilitoris]